MPSDRPQISLRRSAAVALAHAWRAEPRHTWAAVLALTSGALSQVYFAYALKKVIDALGHPAGPGLVWAATGIVATIAAAGVLSFVGGRSLATVASQLRFRLNREALELAAGVPTLELHEDPRHLTQLEAFRREQYQLYAVVPRLVETLATIVRFVAAAVLLASVSPVLLLLPLFGLPALAVSPWTGGMFRVGNERAAEPARRATHLLELTATSGAAKEIRLFRLADLLTARFHAEHRAIRRIHHHLQLRAAGVGLAARLIFVAGYLGAIAFTLRLAVAGQATVGDAVLTAVLAGQVLGLVTGSAELVQVTFQSLVAASRLVYLRDLAAAHTSSQTRSLTTGSPSVGEMPVRVVRGIQLDHVSYTYPGTDRTVVADLTVLLPAGATVAIVGDNGAGKSTLVKLLAGLYRPSAGRILIDGTDLATIHPSDYHQQISACFQDHARFEFTVRDTVGIGDLRGDHPDASRSGAAALDRAGALQMVVDLPKGVDTQLGSSWPGGVDLSGGQWQKLSLARSLMRDSPLLLLLDEPAAALDAATEHNLFERWTQASRHASATRGGVTVVVSHRFATVQTADLILVLDHGRILEIGTHADLIARRGRYAEMYELQARSYR